MATIDAVPAVQYRVLGSTSPHVGVVVEITISTPSGEQVLPAFWLPAEQAAKLAQALQRQAATARQVN